MDGGCASKEDSQTVVVVVSLLLLLLVSNKPSVHHLLPLAPITVEISLTRHPVRLSKRNAHQQKYRRLEKVGRQHQRMSRIYLFCGRMRCLGLGGTEFRSL